MDLPHKTPHCAGRWERRDHQFWRCDRCGAVVHYSADTLNAVAEDSVLGYYLHELTQEGRRLLDQDRTR